MYVQIQSRPSGKRYEYAKCSVRCRAKPMRLEGVLATVERKLSFYDVLPHGTWELPAKTDRDREVSAIKAALRTLDQDDPDYDAKLRGDLRAARIWRNSDRLTVRIDGRDFVREERTLGAKTLGASDFDGTDASEFE